MKKWTRTCLQLYKNLANLEENMSTYGNLQIDYPQLIQKICDFLNAIHYSLGRIIEDPSIVVKTSLRDKIYNSAREHIPQFFAALSELNISSDKKEITQKEIATFFETLQPTLFLLKTKIKLIKEPNQFDENLLKALRPIIRFLKESGLFSKDLNVTPTIISTPKPVQEISQYQSFWALTLFGGEQCNTQTSGNDSQSSQKLTMPLLDEFIEQYRDSTLSLDNQAQRHCH